jgi:transposase
LTQLFSSESFDGANRNVPTQPSSFTTLSTSSEFLNKATTLSESSNNAALTQLLPSNQSVRAVTDLSVNKPAVNFDPSNGSLGGLTESTTSGLITTLHNNLNTNQASTHTTSRLLANRLNVEFLTAPILSNNPLTSSFEFDN